MKIKKKIIDINIKYKKKTVNKIQFYKKNGKKFPLPTEIEISESGTCNRKCSFCPRSAPGYKDIKEFISKELILKIAKELKVLKYTGVVRFSGFVEPMLDKKIFDHIKTLKEYCPSSRVEIVTNGDPLNIDRLKKLFINGLDKILISIYDGPEDLIKFQNMVIEAGLSSHQYILRPRFLSADQDFGITLSNRSGEMEKSEFRIPKLKEPLKNPCYIPSYTLFFDYLGDVLICPHDWGKKMIVGNIKNQNLIDIWLSQKMMDARVKLNRSNRKFSPCNVCDVVGTFMGRKNSSFFA